MGKAELSRLLRSLDEEHHPKIVLHSHHELTNDYNLGGVHFGSSAKKDPEEFMGRNLIVSKTFTSIETLDMASDMFDYVMLSPIFGSNRKRFRNKGLLQEDLAQVKKSKSFPILALGSVGEENIQQAADIGFDGVAIAGYIWRSAVYKKNVERTINKFNRILTRCQHLQNELTN